MRLKSYNLKVSPSNETRPKGIVEVIMSEVVDKFYEFEEFRLNTKERIFLHRDQSVALTPKAFELLCVFVENRGRLITKDELMEKIWADSFVEESNLTFNIRQLRKVLGDDAQTPRFIETVRLHGYRFIAPVTETFESANLLSQIPTPAPVAETEDQTPRIFDEPAESNAEILSPPMAPPPIYRFLPILALAVLFIAGVSAVGLWSRYRANQNASTPILSSEFKSEKLTTSGSVRFAVISPDGKRMAYTQKIGDKQSVWLRQLETSENVQIVADSDENYNGLNFSPDGETVYFIRGIMNKTQTLYRVSTIGGVPKEVVSDVNLWFGVAPDNRRISFVRCARQDDDHCSLYLYDQETKSERKLLTKPKPILIGDNQFAPDGQSLAVAVGQFITGSQEFALIEIDLETGREKPLSERKLFNIRHIRWLPEKKGLLITAFERFYTPSKIFHVSLPDGKIKAMSHDSITYNRLNLDNKFSKMIVTQTIPALNLWTAPADNPEAAQKCCTAQLGLSFAPSGKLVYASITDGTYNIWTSNADGTNQRQLTGKQDANIEPRVSPDEKFIYFASNRNGSRQIWRMNIDGTNQVQITDGEGGVPLFVSPDGKRLYYQTSYKNHLGKMTFDAENKPIYATLANEETIGAGFSPNGEQAAYFVRKDSSNLSEIKVISTADGALLKSFPINDGAPETGAVRWNQNPDEIFYLAITDGRSIITKLSLKTGQTEKYVDLGTEEQTFDFTFSPDGKTLAFVRGKWLHDAYLMTGLK